MSAEVHPHTASLADQLRREHGRLGAVRVLIDGASEHMGDSIVEWGSDVQAYLDLLREVVGESRVTCAALDAVEEVAASYLDGSDGFSTQISVQTAAATAEPCPGPDYVEEFAEEKVVDLRLTFSTGRRVHVGWQKSMDMLGGLLPTDDCDDYEDEE